MAQVDLPLEPIITPAAPAAWPWGLGWWLLILAAVVLVALVITVAIFARQQLWSRHPANRELQAIRQQYPQHNDAWLLDQLARFMRGAAIRIRPTAAGLCNQQWLSWLDETAVSLQFTQGIGQHLVHSRYAPKANLEGRGNDLLDLCQQWLDNYYRSAK